jgi:uncharacterized membrane protein YfcA
LPLLATQSFDSDASEVASVKCTALGGVALTAFDLEKVVFVATSAGSDSGVDLTRMIIYLRSGYLAPNSLVYVVGLLAIAFAGSYLGKLTLDYIDQKYSRKIVLGFILLIGLITFGRAINDIIR